MHALVLHDQTLIVCDPEHGPMREERLLVWIVGIDPSGWVLRRMPCIKMSVEVDNSYASVDFIESAQFRQSY